LLLAAPLAALAAEPTCPPQKLASARFTPGEVLGFKLDALGADVGTFEIRVESAPASEKYRAAVQLVSRAKTSAFISTNVARYDAYAASLVGPDLVPLRYREDVDEGEVHKAIELDFPPSAGTLAVRATKNGEPEPFSLPAGSEVRDMVSTLYLLRAQPLQPGQPVCVEVFAGRKIWKLQGQVAARETIETPLGKFATLRVDADAVRIDDPKVRRAAHVWVTDDDRKLPLVAIGEVRGKVIRAQLVQVTGNGPRKRVAERP
jgi:hypothetical protein